MTLAQLAFDFDPPAPTAPTLPPDSVVETVIAAGLAPNEYVLGINRTLGDWGIDAPAPSRLYFFPIEFMDRKRFDGTSSKLLLRHPDLGELPFVRHVAELTGIRPHWEPTDEFGRDRGALPRWWHAVDLMTEKHWLHLMETRHLTDDAAIAGGVIFALEYGNISTDVARQVLDLLNADEPIDRSEKLLNGKGISPGHIIERNARGKQTSERWPIGVTLRGAAGAWLVVHGIEDGWFKRGRDGHLQMSPDGLARRNGKSP